MSHPTGKAGDAALGDFTATLRLLPITMAALAIGGIAALVAAGLLKLIAFFTNVFFFHRFSMAGVSPAQAALGWGTILAPVAGALVIGLMARFGSERIRGHGIPEALEAILIRGSRIEPRVALLKPVSAAISIGSGGPFGAEGPIIMTGGAIGSILAQFFHLTSAERKTLLVAGAAAGMSATFNAPVAAALLAVELLLFEWKPRSFVPVALASAAAALLRPFLLDSGPLFPVPLHAAFVGPVGLLGCAAAGILAGLLAAAMTWSVYASEDAFLKLPIHWMWWPALGGVAIGLGGLLCPRALGVGYENIASLLGADMATRDTLLLLLVKWTIWAIALGSGTSGGVLAPLLTMGAALGSLEAHFLPDEGRGFWAVVSMAAILGGAMRSPFTAIVFTLELTHDVNALLPLLVAVSCSHAFTVLVLKRSILTEKVDRRGFHVSREYAIDPLEVLRVHEVMTEGCRTLASGTTVREALASVMETHEAESQLLFPVLDQAGRMSGVVTLRDLRQQARNDGLSPVGQLARSSPVTAFPDDPLRLIAYRMAETASTRLPVVDPDDPSHVLGIIALSDLLKARAQHLEEEVRRERHLRLPFEGAEPVSLGAPGVRSRGRARRD
ncbi:MAG: chloride channel protein [Planctomycetes bacterium]|nr:chloride channel protein [Planctomycetota bacterium]